MALPYSGPDWVLADSGNDDSEHRELRECAQRVWSRALTYAHRCSDNEIAFDEREPLATETWERVLTSVARTLKRCPHSRERILNLEAYLLGIFQHRFNRLLKRERQRRQLVQTMPP